MRGCIGPTTGLVVFMAKKRICMPLSGMDTHPPLYPLSRRGCLFENKLLRKMLLYMKGVGEEKNIQNFVVKPEVKTQLLRLA
jgi:hypothetical protein